MAQWITETISRRWVFCEYSCLSKGAIAVVAAVQVLAVGAFLGAPLLVLILLGTGAAVLTLALGAAVVRRSRKARRILVILEVLWMIGAAVDLLLSLFLAKRGLGIVASLTRIVLPYAIFQTLRRPYVRAEFGLGPTRRQRKKALRRQRRDEGLRVAAAGILEPV